MLVIGTAPETCNHQCQSFRSNVCVDTHLGLCHPCEQKSAENEVRGGPHDHHLRQFYYDGTAATYRRYPSARFVISWARRELLDLAASSDGTAWCPRDCWVEVSGAS